MTRAGDIKKKRIKKFKRHHCERYKRLKKSWRKPKGIDSSVRRRFKGKTLMPNIGYGTDKKTRNILHNGLYLIKINNLRELNSLSMSNRKISIEISKNISSYNKKKIIEMAMLMDLKINNPLLN